jgi:VanZ family protein
MPRILRLFYQPWFWFTAYAFWFVLLYFLSEQSSFGPHIHTDFGSDKVAHAICFAGGATVLGLGILLWRRSFPRWGLLLVLLGISLAVGVFDEWHQSSTPGRDGNSLGDVVADVCGGVIGFFLCQWLLGFARKRGAMARSSA